MKSSIAFTLLTLVLLNLPAHAADKPVLTASAPVYQCVNQDDGQILTTTDPDECIANGYFIDGLVDGVPDAGL